MATTGIRGIDVRQASGGKLVFRASLKDSALASLATGTTTLALYELHDDGTLRSYDFNDNTFKTTALTTPTLAMTHRQGNNNTVNTGIWTAVLSVLTGFSVGGVYIAVVSNSGASPVNQEREFQFGAQDGDPAESNVKRYGTAQAGSSTTVTLDAGASALDDSYVGDSIALEAGTGAPALRQITGYVGSTKVATVHRAWGTAPDNTSVFTIRKHVGPTLTAAGAVQVGDKTGFSLSALPAITTDWLTAAGVSAAAATKIANAVEAEIISESDSELVLEAIVNKINAMTDLDALSLSAIAAAVRDVSNASPAAGSVGALLNLLSTKIDTVDDFLDTEMLAVKAKTDLLPSAAIRLVRGAAVAGLPFFMRLTDGTEATGKTVTGKRLFPSGAWAALANSPTEVAEGGYRIDLATTDTDAAHAMYKFTAAGCVPTILSVFFQSPSA